MFTKEIYSARREKLKKILGSGLVLLPGNGEAPINYSDNCYSFRQDSSFLYFVGLDTPDLCCVINLDEGKDYLFGEELSIDDIVWMGDLPSLKERAFSAGITTILPFNQLDNVVKQAKKAGQAIHYLKPYRYRNQLLLSEILQKSNFEILSDYSIPLTKAVVELRMLKDDEELAELSRAGAIGYEMHLAAMKMCKQGMSEREIAGFIEGIAIAKGSRVSFPTILSQNGQILHNHDHSGLLQSGRLMLTDAGAESIRGYASDFTRTTAVNGNYTSKQVDIYNIVLSTINHSIELIKPGVTYQSVHREAYRTIFDGLKALGLTKGNTEDALDCGAPALFMPHGLGHAMGLDVHDMESLGEIFVGYDDVIKRNTMFGYRSLRLGRCLKERFVLTVEPGIYFIPQLIEKWEKEKINADFIQFSKLKDYLNFGGIRLEDDVVVTNDSCRLVNEKRLPITIEEVKETVGS